MFRRLSIALCGLLLIAGPAAAQNPLEGYATPALEASIDAVSKLPEAERTDDRLSDLLPVASPTQFVAMIRAQQAPTAQALRDVLGQVDAARLNKMLSGGPAAGGTGLISSVVAPAVLGAAIEYGDILQERSGTVTTLRGNALGIARFLFGARQFPECPVLAEASCHPPSRRLRAISGGVSFEDTLTGTPAQADTAGGTADLLGDDYRVRAWSVRADLTPSSHLDDPSYGAAWSEAIDTLAQAPEAAQLSDAVADLFTEAALQDDGVYVVWQETTLRLLRAAPQETFRSVLADRLTLLVGLMQAADPDFAARVRDLGRAYANYDVIRQRVLRAAQTHKLSVEYTNRRPLDQPVSSNLRLVYSHQPTGAPAIMTLNAALTWYTDRPAAGSSRWRDLQIGGQVDRRLGAALAASRPVLTLAAYYQWMREDALLSGLDGAALTGTGIAVAQEAVPILGTKGHLAILQGKLSFSIADAVKVPLSITWATRRELVNEKDVRGQIGLTLDLDQIAH